MTKTYITMISLQSRQGLLKTCYRPQGFALKKNRKTSFPIIPVIAEDYREGDTVKILAVRADNMDTPDNYMVFLEELADLGISSDHVTEIPVAEAQGAAAGVGLLLRILDEIPEDSVIRADITFGTKPMSAILLYAMNFVEKLKDAEVEGIYYGEILRRKGEQVEDGAILHDLTVFKLLGDTIDQMEAMKLEDPQKILHRMLERQAEAPV